MRELDNLSGQTFGIWKVIAFDHMKWYGADHKHGMSYYDCECTRCGKHQVVARAQLLRSCARHYNYQKCEVNQGANVI